MKEINVTNIPPCDGQMHGRLTPNLANPGKGIPPTGDMLPGRVSNNLANPGKGIPHNDGELPGRLGGGGAAKKVKKANY